MAPPPIGPKNAPPGAFPAPLQRVSKPRHTLLDLFDASSDGWRPRHAGMVHNGTRQARPRGIHL